MVGKRQNEISIQSFSVEACQANQNTASNLKRSQLKSSLKFQLVNMVVLIFLWMFEYLTFFSHNKDQIFDV